jgi:hypothetical protein
MDTYGVGLKSDSAVEVLARGTRTMTPDSEETVLG